MNEVSTLTSLKAPSDVSIDVPHSIEAEQQLLGALLTNNDLYDRDVMHRVTALAFAVFRPEICYLANRFIL